MATCCDLPDHVNAPALPANGSLERGAGTHSPPGQASASEPDRDLQRELGLRARDPVERALPFSLRGAREIPDGAARTSDWLLSESDDEPGC